MSRKASVKKISDEELLDRAKSIVSGIQQQHVFKTVDGDAQDHLVVAMRNLSEHVIRKEQGLLMPGLSRVAALFDAGFGNCQEHGYQAVVQLVPLTPKVTALFLVTRGKWNHTVIFAGDIKYPSELHMASGGERCQFKHNWQDFLRSQTEGVIVDPFYDTVLLASDARAVSDYIDFCCVKGETDQIFVGAIKDYSKTSGLHERIAEVQKQITDLGPKFRKALLKLLLESATGLTGWKYTTQKGVGKFYHVADSKLPHLTAQSALESHARLGRRDGESKTAGKSILFIQDAHQLPLQLQQYIDAKQLMAQDDTGNRMKLGSSK